MLQNVINKRMQRRAIYTKSDVHVLMHEGQEWNFHDALTREHLHSLHPYPAKFIPQIPRKAIQEWTKKGDVVFDPFCGCGTTLLEASLTGRPSVGVDNNGVAILVTRAKTATYSRTHLKRLRDFADHLDKKLSRTKSRRSPIPDSESLAYWFSDDVLRRLATIKNLILETSVPVRTMLLAIFSSIIVRVSYQDSDTRYAKVKRTVLPSDVDRAFHARLLEVIGRVSEIPNADRAPTTVHQADSRDISFLEDRSVSLIVTSPPYLNAYDYHKYHRQRLHWIDGDIEFARDLEIGKHDEFTKRGATPDRYFADMGACFAEWTRVLRRKGRCLIVIGDAIVSKKPVHVADMFVDLLREHGLSLEKRWIRELKATKRAFNVANSRISHEHVLLLKKA